tara:strand:- start:901 stop:1662 length:762 start_codon:yes stop_codon:yes gene_type:complete
MSRARDTANQINRVNSSAADATAITVTSLEKIGIGTDSPTGKLTVRSGTGQGEALAISSSSSGGNYVTHKHYSSGVIAYTGAGGGAAVGAGTSNDYAIRAESGSLIFATGGNNERARLDSDGLKFHGDTAAANALNDYEEGTWTPTVNSGSLNIGSCKYTKVGRLVTLTLDVVVATGGATQILNAPFTAVNTVGNPIFTSAQNFNTSRTVPTIIIGGGTGTMYFRDIGDNVSWLAMPLTTGASISFSFTYIAL